MKPSIIANKLKKQVRQVIIYGIWLLIWQLGYWIIGKELLVPSPFATFAKLAEMVQEFEFYRQIGATFYRVGAGVLISFIVGVLTAALAYWCYVLEEFLKPIITLMKATPVMAIIILALLWFKSEEIPIFVCFLMCYPVVYTNVLMGFKELSNELKEVDQIYRVSFRVRIKECILPQLMPYLRTALLLIVGIAWKVVIAAEVLAVPRYAMGYELLDAKIYLETTEVFAWIVVIVILSECCEGLVGLILGKGDKKDDHHKGLVQKL